jgi:hydroxymethylpyrimidine/phosphomethylpyrimidine kinase
VKATANLRKRKFPTALTIAGSDSGGGAGVQADLKTFAALGVHGTSAITAITAQNTYSVKAIEEVSTNIVEKQIDVIATDIGVDAAKTGMLSSSEIIFTVARSIKRYKFPFVVVDPVMISKSGAQLLRDDAVETLAKELLPLATLVTPNVPEAEKLTSSKIRNLEDAEEAAKRIVKEYGARAVVVKGGHLGDRESVDVLYYDGRFKEFKMPRISTKHTHGTGCVFSAAIAAELAKGNDIPGAIANAKVFVSRAIEYSLPIGKGHGPVNPASWVLIPAEREKVIESISEAVRMLESSPQVAELVPEVQMNLVMALPSFYARRVDDVAGIPGRIVRLGGGVRASSQPAFGVSSHLARAVLKAMEYDGRIRSVANIKYTEEILRAAKNLGYTITFYDRRDEPVHIKEKEGATLPWIVEQATKKTGQVPDLIYDKGDIGKEPMIRVFGMDAVDVANKIIRIAREHGKKQ